jgi:hypothetical protein
VDAAMRLNGRIQQHDRSVLPSMSVKRKVTVPDGKSRIGGLRNPDVSRRCSGLSHALKKIWELAGAKPSQQKSFVKQPVVSLTAAEVPTLGHA